MNKISRALQNILNHQEIIKKHQKKIDELVNSIKMVIKGRKNEIIQSDLFNRFGEVSWNKEVSEEFLDLHESLTYSELKTKFLEANLGNTVRKDKFGNQWLFCEDTFVKISEERFWNILKKIDKDFLYIRKKIGGNPALGIDTMINTKWFFENTEFRKYCHGVHCALPPIREFRKI